MKRVISLVILYYLRFWAKTALRINKPTVIGITGSVGKSSARDVISTIVSKHFRSQTIEKGNSEVGIPLGILGLHVESLGFETPLRSLFDYLRIMFLAPLSVGFLSGVQYLIVEMAVDEPVPPKNMTYLLSIIKPDIAVFLNVFPVHTMQFEKISGDDPVRAIAKEKGKIITSSGCTIAVYNADNKYVQDIVSKLDIKLNKIKLYSFGQNGGKDVKIQAYRVSSVGTDFEFNISGKNYSLHLRKYLLPEAYGEIIAAGILVGISVGLSVEVILDTLTKGFNLPAGRATVLEGIKKSLIIDSSYNASRASVQAMLNLLMSLKKVYKKRPTAFLFGDMRELGSLSSKEHDYVAQKLFGSVDHLYLVGIQTKEYVLPIVKNKFAEVPWFETSQEAGMYLGSHLPEQAILLVKGSQNTIYLEEAIKHILKNRSDEALLCRQSAHWLEKKGLQTS